jgi:Domain of unknown function (DUF4129)
VIGWPQELPDPSHDSGEVRRAAREILARREYQWRDDRSVIDRVVSWINDQLSRLTVPLGLGNVPVWVGWVVLGLLLVLVAVLIYRAQRGRGRASDRRGGGGYVVVAEGEEAIDWAAEVTRCEAEGRWREGLRARYRVLVGEVAARGVIPDLVGRTTGELLADVRRAAPPLASPFASATSQFEAVWYGGAPSGPAEAQRFAALADQVRAELGAEVASR